MENSTLVPFKPKPVDFNVDRWTGTDSELDSQTKALLTQKGYKDTAGLTSSITKDSSLLQTPSGFRKNTEGVWVQGPFNTPVQISKTELDTLEKRMPGLKKDPIVLDGVMSRYLTIRYAYYLNSDSTQRPDQKMKLDLQIMTLCIEAAFYRETQRGAQEFYFQGKEAWHSSQSRLNAISHGQKVCREFVEQLPKKTDLKI